MMMLLKSFALVALLVGVSSAFEFKATVARDGIAVTSSEWSVECAPVGQDSTVTFTVNVDTTVFSTYNVELVSKVDREEELQQGFQVGISRGQTYDNLAVNTEHVLSTSFGTPSGEQNTEFIAKITATNGGWLNSKEWSSGEAALFADETSCEYPYDGEGSPTNTVAGATQGDSAASVYGGAVSALVLAGVAAFSAL